MKEDANVVNAWMPGWLLLNDFVVKNELGRGGMGAVFLVQSRRTRAWFAVKRALMDDESARLSFLSELQTWIDLPEHPNITACRFFRTIDNEIVIFAEYVGGGTLAASIRAGRMVKLSTKLDAAIQFAWGLHAIHERGLVHQDVKPGNVLLTEEGVVKVTDFGLARARNAGHHGTAQTSGGDDGGLFVSSGGLTPAYCSPEQAAGTRLSPATDVWSWGLSVLEIFAGKPFWVRTTEPAPGRFALGALEQFIAYRGRVPGLAEIPKHVADVLRKCFQQEPKNRWASLAEAGQALVSVHETLVGTPYTRLRPQPVSQVRQPKASHDRRAISGVQWTDPREWLAIVRRLEGLDPSDPQMRGVQATRSRRAQAIENQLNSPTAI